MFRFEEPYYFYALLLIPTLWLVHSFANRMRTKQLGRLGETSLLKKMNIVEEDRESSKFVMFLGVVILTIVSLANPQFGKRTEKGKTQHIDLFLVLDVSQSMLCEDIKPSRLARAQLWIKQFIERFPSERMGLISFAGSAYLHTPLTTDLATVYNMADAASPKNLGTQGTTLAGAIALADKSFGQEEGYHKAIVLLSDGEDHEGEAIDAAKKAYQKGISIFTIPVGTSGGGPIPSIFSGSSSYRTDESGNLILTKPNRSLLSEIAQVAGGEMLEIQGNDQGFDKLRSKFNTLSRKALVYQSFSSYASYFQYFLALAIILLLFETLTIRKQA